MGKKADRRAARIAAARARDAVRTFLIELPEEYRIILEKFRRARIDGSTGHQELIDFDTLDPVLCLGCGKHCTGHDLYDYPLTPEQEDAPRVCKGCRASPPASPSP